MERLDKYLVIKHLAPTRAKSQELIKNNKVLVNNKIVNKCNYSIKDSDLVEVIDNDILKYVSRGGLKLEHALDVFNYSLLNKTMMDIGSSTGGFCDCAVQNGVGKIIAVDVGTNVMHESLRNNSIIDLHEETNIKDLDKKYFNNIDVITVDVSFISLTKIIDIVSLYCHNIDMIVLIKPQFECGKDIADKYKGIILDKEIHKNILNNMINYFNKNNFKVLGIDPSPIKGGDGNIEYVSLITNKDIKSNEIDIDTLVNESFKN